MSTMTRLSIIDSHTAGEPTRMIVSGYPKIEGDTMVARLAYLEAHLDWVRCITMHKPRGHRDIVARFVDFAGQSTLRPMLGLSTWMGEVL